MYEHSQPETEISRRRTVGRLYNVSKYGYWLRQAERIYYALLGVMLKRIVLYYS